MLAYVLITALIVAAIVTTIIVLRPKSSAENWYGWRWRPGWRRGPGWGPGWRGWGLYRPAGWYNAPNLACFNGCCEHDPCRVQGECQWYGPSGRKYTGRPGDCLDFKQCLRNGESEKNCSNKYVQ